MNKFDQRYIQSFIANLLHPDTPKNKILEQVAAEDGFFDGLVQIGSAHLMLPAIYGALKQKDLLNYFPKDLISYLEEITRLNTSRNEKILDQIKFVSDLLRTHNIKHVFLKGAAMLIAKPYNTLEQRMIGDIDVLIAKDDLNKAQEIMVRNGFAPFKGKDLNFTEGLDGFDQIHRHLKRLVHPEHIAAIELHRELLTSKYIRHLPAQCILENIHYHEGFAIPSKEHLWKHAIFNWQYNDRGINRNFLSLRSYMDVIHLEPKNFTNDHLNHSGITHFYSLCSVLTDTYANKNYFAALMFKYQMSYPKLYKISSLFYNIPYVFMLIMNRFILVLTSKTYRQRVFENPKLVTKRFFGMINRV